MSKNVHARRVLTTDNHYQVLGVQRTASSQQIKKAYREMALKYHPDKNSMPQAKQVFNKVVHSYNVLSDEAQRKNHDADLANPKVAQSNRFQNQQRADKNTKQNTTHFKSHYYDEFKQQKDFSRKPSPKKYSSQSKTTENSYEFSSKFKKPSMPQQNNSFRTQDRPKYRASYNHKGNNNGMVLIIIIMSLLIWFIFPSFTAPKPLYTFTAEGQYNFKLKTKLLKVPYFVKSGYDQLTPIPEDTIEKAYVRKLQKQCEKSLNEKKFYEKLAQKAVNEAQKNILVASAAGIDFTSCKKIIKLLKKHPSVKLTTFTNNIIGL